MSHDKMRGRREGRKTIEREAMQWEMGKRLCRQLEYIIMYD